MLGGGAKCPRCKKTVYFAERATGPGGDWHKNCLACLDCRKRLDSTTLAEHDGEAYCKACHGKNFGPKGYGFACGGAGLMSSDTSSSARAPVVNAAKPAPIQSGVVHSSAPVSGGRVEVVAKALFCSQCGAKQAAGARFCAECGNRLAN